ncbi:polyamine ABC transporter substrate-binding protein [Roseomonas sp. HJA6]|uniref:Polyamine ABC transporter substrate-binding protein n=2 Tax=Roseomonas alba TaxID=2846776 RepID=A0ABS7AA35_9PROT|nr:polyamine ABC transporter substrate-binding protein [Neoroseomonas alba]
MRRIAALAALGAAVTFGAMAPAQAQQTTLRVGIASADAGVLDPHLNSSTPGRGFLQWIFNGLVRIKPGELSPEFMEADLAERWESSADGKTWTFHLRQGVQCHGGFGEFTAEDAVFSLNRAATRDTSSFSSDYVAFDRVEAVDRYTVRITLKENIPSLLGAVMNYAGGFQVCKAAVEQLGNEGFRRRPIGTGPFAFAEYVPQQYGRLVANDQYFRGKPQIREVMYRFIPSDAARDLAFQAGELDMIYGRQDQTWFTRTQQLPNVRVIAMQPAEMSVIHLNMTMPPLDDIRVRQAIAHAINRDQIVQLRGPNTSVTALSVVPRGYLGHNPNAPLLPPDIARARALLAEAGHPNGITIRAIHTTLPGMMSVMEGIQAQLRRAGITLEITPVEHATFHQQIRQNLSQVVHFQAARFPVADVYLTQFFHSRSIVGTPTAVTNFSHCRVADAEIDAARGETDRDRAIALWRTAQDKIVREVCAVPVYEQMQLWAYRTNLDLGYELKASLNLAPPLLETTRFTR